MKLAMKALDMKGPEKYERSKEQMEKDAAVAKEYNRQMFIRDNQHHKLLNLKIRLRDNAVLALPGAFA